MHTRHRSVQFLVWGGISCLIVVVFTHVAEAMRWFPGMGWGLPNSPGHYVDLLSAIAGATLLVVAGVLRLFCTRLKAHAQRRAKQD